MLFARLQDFAAVFLAFAVIGAAAVAPAPVEAAAKHAPRVKYKFVRGSGENDTQRDKRLARECRGRPNAGACLGFGQ